MTAFGKARAAVFARAHRLRALTPAWRRGQHKAGAARSLAAARMPKPPDARAPPCAKAMAAAPRQPMAAAPKARLGIAGARACRPRLAAALIQGIS